MRRKKPSWLQSNVLALRRADARAGFAFATVLAPFSFSSCHAKPAADVEVAVAANFAPALQTLCAEFSNETGRRVEVVVGATAKLYAQIENGAPYDMLLAADESTPVKLQAEGRAAPGDRFTYALGTLVLWSARSDFVDADGRVLREGHFAHLAIANPKLAPYGAAAMQVIESLGLSDAVGPKLVLGESVAQAAEFVATENAEMGFVALSQVATSMHRAGGSYWTVPKGLYAPLRQDAVLLSRGAENPAARLLFNFLRSEKARDRIRASGYGLDPAPSLPARP